MICISLAPHQSPADTPSSIDHSPRTGKAEQIVEYMQQQHDAGQFNGAFLVADGEGVLAEAAFGFANEEWQIPNTPDTRYRIGSLTKQFTAALVMNLVDEGRLSLDTPLTSVLPWYRADTGAQVTIRQLLNHSSGIDRRTVVQLIKEHGRTPMPLADEVREYCSGDLEWAPGEDFGYNNCGYLILGAVIEEVCRKPYADVLQEVLLDSVGLRDTGLDDGSRVIERYASGYDLTDEGLRRPQFIHAALAASAGGVWSTVRDLYLWDRALYGDTVLSEAAREEMFTPGLGGAGFGWFIEEVKAGNEPRTMIHHPGQGDGFWSAMYRFPQDRAVIILINNHGRTDLNAMVDGILEVMYGPNSAR
jgi:CubicO group peptidase (beta-lactamase class C family)